MRRFPFSLSTFQPLFSLSSRLQSGTSARSSGCAVLHPRQLPRLVRLVQLRQGNGLAEALELGQLPQLRVLPERVVDVHADGDQAARAVEETEVEDIVADELAHRVA